MRKPTFWWCISFILHVYLNRNENFQIIKNPYHFIFFKFQISSTSYLVSVWLSKCFQSIATDESGIPSYKPGILFEFLYMSWTPFYFYVKLNLAICFGTSVSEIMIILCSNFLKETLSSTVIWMSSFKVRFVKI